MTLKKYLLIFLAAGILFGFGHATQRDRFVFTQLKYNGDWDPYPFVYRDVLSFITVATSIRVVPERRVLTLDSRMLYSSPFLVMMNKGEFGGFSEKQRDSLRRYLDNGGTLFIEDNSGNITSPFDMRIRQELEELYPGEGLRKLRKDNVLYRTFYLIRHVTGRKLINNYIEGMDVGGRTAILYSRNDMFGVWVRDNFGNFFLKCVPGGEEQRFEAQKLTANLIVYSVTGTYKSDTIHQPFIRKKLGID